MSLVKSIYRPFNAVGSAVYSAAARRIASSEGPLYDHITAADASGTDLVAEVNQEFYRNWLALWPYRQQRFWDEFAHVRNGGVISLAAFSLKDAVVVTRLFVRILASFMFGIMFFRWSQLPLMSPSSPLVQGLEFMNPNDL